jgi:hypothetical protein
MSWRDRRGIREALALWIDGGKKAARTLTSDLRRGPREAGKLLDLPSQRTEESAASGAKVAAKRKPAGCHP